MPAKRRLVIGIDPDVDASGLGFVNIKPGRTAVEYCTCPLPLLIEYIKTLAEHNPESIEIYIEAGWLNHGNWHINPKDNKQLAAAKGRQAGRNHQLGLDICAMLNHYNIPHTEVPPLLKCWKGRDRKITHGELDTIVRGINGVGLPRKRSNQEERDALLIAWVRSGLPIKC